MSGIVDYRNTTEFLKRSQTNTGAVKVHSHYIRNDITCGIKECELCCGEAPFQMTIPSNGVVYIITDDVLLHYISFDDNIFDLIVKFPELFSNIVVFESSLYLYRKVKGIQLFKQLKSALESGLYNCTVFNNVHHFKTFLFQESDETVDDHYECMFLNSVDWYLNHLSQCLQPILTERHSSFSVLVVKSLSSISQSTMLSSLCTTEVLKNSYSICENRYQTDQSTIVGSESIPSTHILEGTLFVSEDRMSGHVDVQAEALRSIIVKYYTSTILASQQGSDKFVSIDDLFQFDKKTKYSVQLSGMSSIRPGIHGDTVHIGILPFQEWVTELSNDFVLSEDEESTIVLSTDNSHQRFVTGRVIDVIQQGKREFVCSVSASTDASDASSLVLMVPLNKRIPCCCIHSHNLDAILGSKHLIRYLDWPADCRYPNGQFIQTIGKENSFDTDSIALLYEANLETHIHPIPSSMLSSIEHIPRENLNNVNAVYTPTEMDCLNREDIRETHNVVSIDPPGCVDIDDAASLRELPDCYEVGIHIADVCYYLPFNSPLDRFARERSTSVYLVDRRIDMLPPVLSTNVCSLRAQYDRLAVSTFLYLDKKTLNVIKPPRFCRSILRSRYSLAYPQAQRLANHQPPGIIENPYANPDSPYAYTGSEVEKKDWEWLGHDIEILMRIGRDLRERRRKNGAVELATRELKFTDSQEETISVKEYEHLEIHETIEELMVVANSVVSQKIISFFPSCSLLRRHECPPKERLTLLHSICDYLHLPCQTANNLQFAKTIQYIQKHCNEAQRDMLMILFRNSMSEAQYVCSGDRSVNTDDCANPFSHYGLGIDYYTHFTSPIRRYADIIAHRQLLSCIELEKRGNKTNEINQFSQDKGYDLFKVTSQAVSLLDGEAKVWVTGEAVRRELVQKDKGEEVDDDFFNELIGESEEEEKNEEVDDDFFNELIGESEEEEKNEEVDDDFFNELIGESEGEEKNEKMNKDSSDHSVQDKKEDVIMNSSPSYDREALFTKEEMASISKHLNEQNRKAKRVSQLSDNLYIKYYIYYNQPQIRECIVSAVHTNGISLSIPFFDITLGISFTDSFGVPEEWVQELYHVKQLSFTYTVDETKTLLDPSTNQLSGAKTRIELHGETGKVAEFSLYQHLYASLTSTIVNPHTKNMRISAVITKETMERSVDEEEKETLKKLREEREQIQVNEKEDQYCRLEGLENITLVKTRKDLLDDVHRVQNGNFGDKLDLSNDLHQATRFQFGGFITERLSFKQKWMEEYADFADMETNEGDTPAFSRRITDGDVDVKKLEYDAMDRQRKLKNFKFNERKKAAIKRQQ